MIQVEAIDEEDCSIHEGAQKRKPSGSQPGGAQRTSSPLGMNSIKILLLSFMLVNLEFISIKIVRKKVR